MKRYGNLLLTADVAEGGEQAVATAEPKPPITFDVEEFVDGDFKGFKFTVPEFNQVGAAVDQFGEATLLALINSACAARIRTKVKNGLPKNLKPAELTVKQQELLQKYPGGLLFTQEEAGKWRPEVRELTPNQLFKRAKELFKKAAEEPQNAGKYIAEAQGLLVEMGKVMQG